MKIAQNKAFGRSQSFVAGPPKNGLQFMVKDSRKYASTGGRGSRNSMTANLPMHGHKTCFACHQAVPARDFVFTRSAPRAPFGTKRESTRPVKTSLSHPDVTISSVRMRAQQSRRAS